MGFTPGTPPRSRPFVFAAKRGKLKVTGGRPHGREAYFLEPVKLSVRTLVEFVLRCGDIDARAAAGGYDRANEGARIHRKLQKAAGKGYQAEVSFKATRVVDGIEYRLEGRADGIIETPGGYVVDEIKTTSAPAERLTEDYNPLHWAQAKCYAAFLCKEKKLPGVTVQLTYYQVDTEETVRHRRLYGALELENFLTRTLHLYTPWAKMAAEWREKRTESLKALRFPFAEYRAGQYRLAGAVYKTIAGGGRLFACAPTGVGKTISTLFPAVKALGEGKAGRIFYLTAKTVTRTAAEGAVARLRESQPGLCLKCVTLTAKDKACPLEERQCTPQHCPRARGYYDRVNDALYRFLNAHSHFTREAIAAFCEAEALCPFEFTLDLSLFCDCIICDYNYLFDPVVSLKRFFDGTRGEHVFLIDEAHNLAGRARDMYSASICKSAFLSAKKAVGKSHKKLAKALTGVNSALLALRKAHAGARKALVPQGDKQLARLLSRFETAAQDYLDEHREGAVHDEVLQLYFDVHFYLRIWELYDEHFTTLIHVHGADVTVRLMCLDAAPFLDASMAQGQAAVLFSATLAPVDYFIETLGGGENAKRIFLQSPFPQENLCLLCAGGVSTKYAQRQRTLPEVCRYIEAVVRAKQGNYLVFLPSYAYLKAAVEEFRALCPGIALAVQESGMDEAAREAFLAQFSPHGGGTLVGFCVLGGVFGEGIDLAGAALIGCVVVGVGLPQISPEQDALRDYYQAARGSGFAYAYQFPGMNKVLQAAGRVIRTKEDRGVVLLIDSRYTRAEYRCLMPPHWGHLRYVSAPGQAQALVQAFWSQTKKEDEAE